MKRWVPPLLVLLLLGYFAVDQFIGYAPTPTETLAPTLRSATQEAPSQSSAQTPILVSTQAILKGCVDVSSLRVRSGPGTHYDMVDGLSFGDCLSFDAKNDVSTWARILGTSNWVSFEFIDSSGNIGFLPVANPRIANLSTSQSSVKSTPSQTYKPSSAYIPSGEAKDYIGQIVTIRISYAYCEFNREVPATFCNDAQYPNHNFTMIKWDKVWSDYDGLCIMVTGQVLSFLGKPQIVVGSRSQVSTC